MPVWVACFALPQFAIAVERTRCPSLWGEPVALTMPDGGQSPVVSHQSSALRQQNSGLSTLDSQLSTPASGLTTHDSRLTTPLQRLTIVAAVSEEAQRFGVRVGQPISGARSLCPGLTVLPYDRPAYDEAAQLLWNVLAVESSVVEPVCPEVCYVGMRGSDVPERVRCLAREIARCVRVPVQVGLARTKLLARQAARTSRDAQVVSVSFGEEAALLSSVPLAQIPRLDFKLRQRLDKLGVRTLGDVLALPPSELRRHLRGVGHLLHRLAMGEDGEPVRPLWPPPSIERTFRFEDEVVTREPLEQALHRLASEIAVALEKRRTYGRALALTIGLADESRLHAAERLAQPLDGTEPIYRSALRLLGRLRVEQPVAEAALKMSDLGVGSGVQLALLDENRYGQGLPHERRARLEETLAYLRKRFGIGAVVPLRMLKEARRIGLWTYALTHRCSEPVEVATDRSGAPVRYWRRGGDGQVTRREVRRIQNRWKETEWFWGSRSERTVFRVETNPDGLFELHRLGVEWRLNGVAD